MFEHTTAIDPVVEPPWIYWWSEADTHYLAGQAALTMGNANQAEAYYRNALARVDPAHQRPGDQTIRYQIRRPTPNRPSHLTKTAKS